MPSQSTSATAASAAAVRLELLSALTDFYFEHAPKFAGKTGKILRKYKGREDMIWRSLFSKYGAVPDFDLGRLDRAFANPDLAWNKAAAAAAAAATAAESSDTEGGHEAKVTSKTADMAPAGIQQSLNNRRPTKNGGGLLGAARKAAAKTSKPTAKTTRPTAVDTRIRRVPHGRGNGNGNVSASDGSSISPTVRDAARRSAVRAASKSPARGGSKGSSARDSPASSSASSSARQRRTRGQEKAAAFASSASSSSSDADSASDAGVEDAEYDDNDDYDARYGVVKLNAAQLRAQELARKLLNAAIQVPRAQNAPWGVNSANHHTSSPHSGAAGTNGAANVDSESSADDSFEEHVSDDPDSDGVTALPASRRWSAQRNVSSRGGSLQRPESRSGRDTRELRKMEQATASAAILHDMSQSSSVLKLLRASSKKSNVRAQGAAISGSSGSSRFRSKARSGKGSSRSNQNKPTSARLDSDSVPRPSSGASRRTRFGRDDMVLAADRGDLRFFQNVLEEGGLSGANDIHECRGMGLYTPLHFAARQGHSDLVRFLLSDPRLRCDPNARDKSLDTPLHLAAGGGNVRSVDFLIDSKADPNAVNKEEETPLFAASRKGHSGILRCLLQSGADASLKNRFGELPQEDAPLGWAQTLFETMPQHTSRNLASSAALLPSAALQTVIVYLQPRDLAAVYATCSRWHREVGASEAWRASQELHRLQWQSLTNNPFGDTAMSSLLRPSSVGSSSPGTAANASSGMAAARRSLTTAPSRLGATGAVVQAGTRSSRRSSSGLGGLGIGMLGGPSSFGSGALGFLSRGSSSGGGSKLSGGEGKVSPGEGKRSLGRSGSSRGSLVFSSPSGGDFF